MPVVLVRLIFISSLYKTLNARYGIYTTNNKQ